MVNSSYLFILLLDGFYALLSRNVNDRSEPVWNMHADWNQLKSVETIRSMLIDMQEHDCIDLDAIWLINDRDMRSGMATLLRMGLGLKAGCVRLQDWEPLVAGRGGVFDYPAPPLEKLYPVLEELASCCVEQNMTYAPSETDSGLRVRLKCLEEEKSNIQPQSERERQTLESFHAECQKHEDQIQKLQEQLHALQSPSIEHLLTYLPAFYRNFFGTVRPDELALLVGTLQVPELPSPFPDPSSNTVHMLRKKFLNLPTEEQARVLGFCRQLTYRLEVRPEMADLL